MWTDYLVLIPFSLPIITFIYLFIEWYRKGKESKIKGTVIPLFEAPDDLSAAQVGALIDEIVNQHDIVTVILDYALKGYLKMTFLEGEYGRYYEFEIIKDYNKAPNIKPHEKIILDSIFNLGFNKKIKLSESQGLLKGKVGKITTQIYKDLEDSGHFIKGTQARRERYTLIGVGLTILPFVIFSQTPFGNASWSTGILVSLVACGALFLFFSSGMPKKTKKGVQAMLAIKGLEEYLKTAEIDKIKSQAKDKILFEKLLPYAIALGLEKDWSAMFGHMFQFNTIDGFVYKTQEKHTAELFAREIRQFEEDTFAELVKREKS